MKSIEAMILAVTNAIWASSQVHREAWKIQDFKGVWTRNLAMPVRRSNQLSYEATDVGSWPPVGSYVPVMNEYMNEMMYEMNHIKLRIWNLVKLSILATGSQLLLIC